MEDKLTSTILGCAYEVIKELGTGFLESVYKNALYLTLLEEGINIEVEKHFEVYFRNKMVGLYKADLIAEGRVLIELKCCKLLLAEHQAQVINYLKASGLTTALLINFGNRSLEHRRLVHPSFYPARPKGRFLPALDREGSGEPSR